jgi:hypothetical protein
VSIVVDRWYDRIYKVIKGFNQFINDFDQFINDFDQFINDFDQKL